MTHREEGGETWEGGQAPRIELRIHVFNKPPLFDPRRVTLCVALCDTHCALLAINALVQLDEWPVRPF